MNKDALLWLGGILLGLPVVAGLMIKWCDFVFGVMF
jgi:hypothetical protein